MKRSNLNTYGSGKTALVLSETAERAYNAISPITITEKPGNLYDVTGTIERYDMTADEVNEFLEELYNDLED